jgi:DNA polymerase-3 subunit gamma/tau
VCGADSELIAATPDQRPGLERAAAQFGEEDLTRFFQILLQTDDDLRRKPDPRMHLEMGLLRLINASRLAPLEELLAEVRAGAPAGGTATGAARATSGASIPAVSRREATSATPVPFAAASRNSMSATAPAAPSRAEQTSAMRANAATPSERVGGGQPETEARLNADQAVTAAPQERSQPMAVPLASGISDEQVGQIKEAIQAQQKFLGELVEHGNRWELEGAELRIYFSSDKRAFAEMLEGRDALEKVRNASSKVLGRAVRVCAKLEAVAAAAASASRSSSATQELRAQFERDPMVKSMLQRFGGKIAEVKHRPEET